jgi:hypothetical protein
MNLLEALASKNIEDWRDQQVPTVGPGQPNVLGQMLMQPQDQGLLSTLLGFHDIPASTLLGQLRGGIQRVGEDKARANAGLTETQSAMGEALRKYGERRMQDEMLAQRQYYMPRDEDKAGTFPQVQNKPGGILNMEGLLRAMARKTEQAGQGPGAVEYKINPQSWEDFLARAPVSQNVEDERGGLVRIARDPYVAAPIDRLAMAAGYGSIASPREPLPRPRPKKKDD